ncbi:MAG TPA: hypothetical protein VN643_06645 [Pyrinomonadaceae bacterium]|nr:hypothetical protein [Pyrinomonadaceae bacterium]
MTDGQSLILVLAAIYLFECFLWLRKQSIAFVAPWCRQFKTASGAFGNTTGGILFVNPLPPLGSVYVSHLAPVSISPVGVCAFNLQALPSVGRPPQSGRFIPFSEITTATTDGANLLIDQQQFVKCATAAQAKEFAELITKTAKASASERERMLRAHLADQFALDKAAKILRGGKRIVTPVRWMCAMLFVFLFIAAPLLVTTFGLLRLLIPLAVVMILFSIQISLMFHFARKALYPGEPRWDQTLTMMLCPPVSIRAADLLTRELLSRYSPVVLASLLAGARAPQFIRSFILDLQHPLKHEVTEDLGVETVRWAASQQLHFSLEHIKHGGGLKRNVLLAPLEAQGTASSHCPRCECQFTVDSGECPDCPGLELAAFSNSR